MVGMRIFMCLNVRGAIANLQHQRSERTPYNDNDGRPLNKNEALAALTIELAKGHAVIPMHEGCGKPCKNSSACAGFNHAEGGGCPGFPMEATPA